jgi:hypothetical protein
MFSAEWQNQRENKIKKCPLCGTEVEAIFGGRTFTKWLVASGAVIAAITFAVNGSVLGAVLNGLALGMGLALLPSMELQPRIQPDSRDRNFWNRPIDLPSWLKPPAWLDYLVKSIWAVGSYLFMLVAVALGIPSPWSGAFLVFLGVIGLIPRESSLCSSKVKAIVLRIGAAGMLVAGASLLVHHYI